VRPAGRRKVLDHHRREETMAGKVVALVATVVLGALFVYLYQALEPIEQGVLLFGSIATLALRK
jgi:hypothetical protein